MRHALFLAAAISMIGAAYGCSRTLDRSRADYHEYKADRAAANGRYEKAAAHEAKAHAARREAATDPMP